MTTTTLKLDWTARRVDNVVTALVPHLSPENLGQVWLDLEPYLDVDDPGATLKLTWSPELIDAVTTALDAYVADSQARAERGRAGRIGPSYEERVARQTDARAAAREIREYRAAVEAVKARNVAVDHFCDVAFDETHDLYHD
jgi:hypothetical protein